MNQADQRAAILAAFDQAHMMLDRAEIADLLLQVANAPLHTELAAERLRADQGWARYENANQGHMQARAEVQRLNEEIAKLLVFCALPPERLPGSGNAVLLKIPQSVPPTAYRTAAECLAKSAGCEVVIMPAEFTVTGFHLGLTQSELTHLRQTQMVDDLPDQFINSMFAELLLCRLQDLVVCAPTTSPYTIVANWCQERADVMKSTVGASHDPQQEKYEPVFAAISTLEETADYCKRMLTGAVVPPIPDELLQIGELLRTQNNRITDQPMFLVEELVLDATTDDYSDGFEWRDNSTGMLDYVSELRAKRLELLYHRGRDYKSHYIRIATRKRWQFITACLTEQGCKDYLARDGHNLGKTRIYAGGSYRNNEYRAVRKWLMSLPPPAGVVGVAS